MTDYSEYTDAEIIAALAEHHNWARVEGTLADGYTFNLSATGDYGWQGVSDEQIEAAIATAKAT